MNGQHDSQAPGLPAQSFSVFPGQNRLGHPVLRQPCRFLRRRMGDHQQGAVDPRLPQLDRFLQIGYTQPVNAVLLQLTCHMNRSVPVSIRFYDSHHPAARLQGMADCLHVFPQLIQIHLSPGTMQKRVHVLSLSLIRFACSLYPFPGQGSTDCRKKLPYGTK